MLAGPALGEELRSRRSEEPSRPRPEAAPGGAEQGDFEFPFVRFEDIVAATENFFEVCKIGQGGFEKVYKVNSAIFFKKNIFCPEHKVIFFDQYRINLI